MSIRKELKYIVIWRQMEEDGLDVSIKKPSKILIRELLQVWTYLPKKQIMSYPF